MNLSRLSSPKLRIPLALGLAGTCLLALPACGTSIRDGFYRSRVTGIAPMERGAPASAAVFRSDDPKNAG